MLFPHKPQAPQRSLASNTDFLTRHLIVDGHLLSSENETGKFRRTCPKEIQGVVSYYDDDDQRKYIKCKRVNCKCD